MKITRGGVTSSLVLVVGFLVNACGAKQAAPPEQPQVQSAEAPASASSTAAEPTGSATPVDNAPAPSATPEAAAGATLPTTPTPAAEQGGGAATAPASHATSTASSKPAASASSTTGTTSAASDSSTKYSGDSPCTASSFKFAAVRNACQHGGRPEVKGVMKGVTNKAKAAGTDLKCTNCHSDLKTYGLKDNAVDDLRKWL